MTPMPEMKLVMDSKKKKTIQSKGWITGEASDFIDLSPAEARLIDLKFALRACLKEERTKLNVTQEELAKAMGSSQARIAKMERGDPAASVDLLLRALMALGMTNKQISKIFAKRLVFLLAIYRHGALPRASSKFNIAPSPRPVGRSF